MKTETSTPGPTTHTTHTTTHSTTTRKPLPDGKVVLITGGFSRKDGNATSHSAEIFLPKRQPCILPDLPAPYYQHTQDGGMICGGSRTQDTCRRWSPKEGKFPETPVHKFTPGRYLHVSWTPVYEKETFLIGGSSYAARNSSNVVKRGVFEGSKGFPKGLKYPLAGACSIPDPETDTVIITGGNYNPSPPYQATSVYNEDGWVEDLGNLTYPRRYHGCASYLAGKKRIFIVAGGYQSSEDNPIPTEILQDKSWTVLKNGNLPDNAYLRGLRLATLDNHVFSFGGIRAVGKKLFSISSIFKFNIDEKKWYNTTYQMSRPRSYQGISIVDFKYYSKFCLG